MSGDVICNLFNIERQESWLEAVCALAGLLVNDLYCRVVGWVPDTSYDLLVGLFGWNVIEKNPSTKWLRNISFSLMWEKSRFGRLRLVRQYHIIRDVGSRLLATPSLRASASLSRCLLKLLQLHLHYKRLEKEMATHSSVLAWRIPRQRSLAGYSPWGCTLSNTTEVT